MPDPIDPGCEGAPATRAQLDADQAELGRALEQLSNDQRLVLVLRFLRGLSHAEVAQQMGRTHEATRALQHRALSRMRQLMQEPRQPAA